MKSTFKIIIIFAACLTLMYTACKKSSSNKITPPISESVVAGLVAKSVTSSLAGQHGGMNVSDGIKVSPNILQSIKTPAVNSLLSLCGYKIDTTVNYNINVGDTVKSNAVGKFTFTYLCSSTIPDGYTTTSNLVNTGFGPGYTFTYLFTENITVKAVDPSYTLLSLDGGLTSFGDFKYAPKSAFIDTNFKPKPVFEHDTFNYIALRIDLTKNADIISGSATFSTTGSNANGTWNYQGTIVFIGNHMATIMINGKLYKANLLTGEITPM